MGFNAIVRWRLMGGCSRQQQLLLSLLPLTGPPPIAAPRCDALLPAVPTPTPLDKALRHTLAAEVAGALPAPAAAPIARQRPARPQRPLRRLAPATYRTGVATVVIDATPAAASAPCGAAPLMPRPQDREARHHTPRGP